jgi:hypothetical protein
VAYLRPANALALLVATSLTNTSWALLVASLPPWCWRWVLPTS